LNTEENKREPTAREGSSEELDEAQGAPSDPVSVEQQAGEDPGALLDPEPPAEEADFAEEPNASEEKLATLEAQLEQTRWERDEYLDALRRLKAEFDNSRKRQQREHARILETASEKIVVELLPVLDNLDRALEAEGDIHGGVRAIRDQLIAVLGNEGLLPVSSDGQHFDPNVHEAVMGQPSEEHEEGTILQTFQRGYLLNGKPIRAAKVVVARQV
jgi:molecular chaperone GrpE